MSLEGVVGHANPSDRKVLQGGRKMIHRHSSLLSGILTFLSVLVFTGLVAGQGQDRGIITGLVTDKSGAAVPSATVTITNEATGVNTGVSTTSAGTYNTPPLSLG